MSEHHVPWENNHSWCFSVLLQWMSCICHLLRKRAHINCYSVNSQYLLQLGRGLSRTDRLLRWGWGGGGGGARLSWDWNFHPLQKNWVPSMAWNAMKILHKSVMVWKSYPPITAPRNVINDQSLNIIPLVHSFSSQAGQFSGFLCAATLFF